MTRNCYFMILSLNTIPYMSLEQCESPAEMKSNFLLMKKKKNGSGSF